MGRTLRKVSVAGAKVAAAAEFVLVIAAADWNVCLLSDFPLSCLFFLFGLA